jgi:hypothetical protein
MTRHRRKTKRAAPLQPQDLAHGSRLRGSADGRHQARGKHVSTEPGLVRFDASTRGFLCLLLLLWAFGTGLKVHGSSVGVWNRITPDRRPDAGVLWGSPKTIRSDEWLVNTPAIVSQANSRPAFPTVNPRWGPAEVPLIFNWPTRHWSMLLRPQFWGFFILDLERAYAFYWGMKGLLVLGGVFLLLMILTDNHFGVSLLGTFWVFFSGFTQWWYSMPLEMIGCVALLVVALHYLALSSRRWVILASALVFSICSFDFALLFYPPYQVPLFYLGIAILAGSLGPRLFAGASRGHLALRAGCMAAALIALAVLFALFYRDAKQAILLMRATVYPGARLVTGGDVTIAQVFSGFFGFFMTQERYPQQWGNVCEASNFVMLFPVPVAALLWRAWRRQRVEGLEWALTIYLVVLLTWITIGLPRPLAAASALSLTQPIRSLLGLGLGNIILCCIFLAKCHDDTRAAGWRLLIAGSWAALLLLLALDFNRATSGFVTPKQIAVVIFIGGAAAYLLLVRKRISFSLCVLVPHIWSYALVNPVTVGLGPILDNQISQRVSHIVNQDPKARWAVYADFIIANFLKSAGAQVFNGTKVIPPLEDFRVIDPNSKVIDTYNRYAHIMLVPTQDAHVSFTLHQADLYEIRIDPKSDLWRQLGIRYVVLPFVPTDPELLEKMAPVLALPEARLWIYRYKWPIVSGRGG